MQDYYYLDTGTVVSRFKNKEERDAVVFCMREVRDKGCWVIISPKTAKELHEKAGNPSWYKDYWFAEDLPEEKLSIRVYCESFDKVET